MRLKNFCVQLQRDSLTNLMVQWKENLKEEYDHLSRFIYPTDKLAIVYPKNPWCFYRIVIHKDGRIVGINDKDVFDRVKLTQADILLHKADLKQFRREMCEGFGLNPPSEEVGKLLHGFHWGTWEPEKGAAFPVTMLCVGNDFRGQVFERILRRKVPGEMIITPTRYGWTSDLEELARNNKVLLIPLDAIIQMMDGKLTPTPEWDEYLTAFCKMVEMDLPSRFQKKASEFMLVKRGAWVFRFGKKETIADADWLGPAFLQFLLQNPDAEFHVEKLWQTVMGMPTGTRFEHAFADEGTDMPESLLGGADEILDAEAKNAYEKRLKELIVERREAEEDRDEAALELINSEFETIRIALESSSGGMHRPKKLGDPVVRLRDRIRRGINTFIDHVSNHDPEGGQYLRNTIKRGIFMQYSPSQKLDWILS